MTVTLSEDDVLVSVMPLPPGEDVDCLLPPEPECPLRSLDEVGGGEVRGEHCLCLRVESVETHITQQTHLVAENRVRCVLRDGMSDLKCYCWFFGEYSDELVRHGVRTGDMVIMLRPRVVRTKLKFKQVLPEDMSCWTIHCLMADRLPVTLVKVDQERRKEQEQERSKVAEDVAPDQDPCNIAIDALIDAINNDSDSEFRSQPRPSEAGAGGGPATSTQDINAPPPASSVSPVRPPSASIRPPARDVARLGSPRAQTRPHYTLLAQCRQHKQRYNVMAVLSQVLETPRRRKSKIVAKVTITDESLEIAGDLREHFKFDILTDSMEQMPDLEV